MRQFDIYIDEDAVDTDLVSALRRRGILALTPFEVSLMERSDEEQLLFAFQRSCVLYTFNVSDFDALHTHLLATRDCAEFLGRWG